MGSPGLDAGREDGGAIAQVAGLHPHALSIEPQAVTPDEPNHLVGRLSRTRLHAELGSIGRTPIRHSQTETGRIHAPNDSVALLRRADICVPEDHSDHEKARCGKSSRSNSCSSNSLVTCAHSSMSLFTVAALHPQRLRSAGTCLPHVARRAGMEEVPVRASDVHWTRAPTGTSVSGTVAAEASQQNGVASHIVTSLGIAI